MNMKALLVLHASFAGLVFAGTAAAGLRASVKNGLLCFVPALLLLIWFVSSIGMYWLKKWAWWGSFGSVLGVCCILAYLAILPVPSSAHSDPSGFLMLVYVALMTPFAGALMLLLLIRRKVFGGAS